MKYFQTKKEFIMTKKGTLSLITLLLLTIQYISAQDVPKIDIGGALRFSYNYSDWAESNKDRGGDFGYDVFRVNAKAEYKGFKLNAEYRFYDEAFGGGMLKRGEIGYDFDSKNNIKVGLTGVPFGLLPYTSNNFFFNINYYVGLEDDDDMGIKYTYNDGKIEFNAAFFKNSDLFSYSETSETADGRYSYDVAGRNKETNQGNLRAAYNFGKTFKSQLGLSAMYGGLYNLDTKKTGSHSAFAAHYMMNYKRWNLKTEYAYYKMDPENADGETGDIVKMTAYGAPYEVAAEGNVYSAALSYNLPVNLKMIQSITFYNDFSMLDKVKKEFNDSYQEVIGFMVTSGSIYTYFDWVFGKNQAWIGDDWNNAFGKGISDADWNMRFNVNIGYYF